MKRISLYRCILFLSFMTATITTAAEENYLSKSIRATILVADAEQAADRLESWVNNQDGYVLHKSSEKVVLRIPFPRAFELRPFLELLSDDVLEYSPQATNIREDILSTESKLRSREEILGKNKALLDQADIKGTLDIERELLTLIKEVEDLRAALQKLTLNRTFTLAEVYLKFLQPSLPSHLPSSFNWINEVDFQTFIAQVPDNKRVFFKTLKVDTPEHFAELKTGKNYWMLSPEGMKYRVLTFSNEPEMSLDFWSDSLKNHLLKEGYHLNKGLQTFRTKEHEGHFFEWVIPYIDEDYIFMTAVLVFPKKIILAEAAAPYSTYNLHREALKKSLKSIRYR